MAGGVGEFCYFVVEVESLGASTFAVESTFTVVESLLADSVLSAFFPQEKASAIIANANTTLNLVFIVIELNFGLYQKKGGG
jgi:hypothetical protein